MNFCESYIRTYTVPRCQATKELDACNCGGDKTKCDFYPHMRDEALWQEKRNEFMTDIFLSTLNRLAALGYSLEFEPREYCIICRVRDLNGHRGVNKRISCAELLISRLGPEEHIFKVVDLAIDELEATDTTNEVNR